MTDILWFHIFSFMASAAAVPTPGTAVQGVAFLAALGLALIHLYAGKLRFLGGTPRSIWLSFAGGVSVAYVFVHLLPEVSETQAVLEAALGSALGFLKNHGFLVSLVGLVVFYGLESAAKASRKRRGEEQTTSAGVFWLHIGSFALYNLLIGYLLVRRPEQGLLTLTLFFVAMALHFVVNDFGLREHHKVAYTRTRRWVLAAAVLLGWGTAALFGEVSDTTLAVLLAFLAGGVVLNVLKEELPAERESRFWPFALGAVVYAALLLAV